MKRRFLQFASGLLSLVILGVALWALRHALGHYRYRDVIRELYAIPPPRILLALLFTVCAYFVLQWYDALAVRYAGHMLSWKRTSLVAFLAYAIGHNTGFASLGTTSVRYRMYSGWKLSAIEIARIVAFCSVTYWVGFAAIGGFLFLFHSFPLPSHVRLPFDTVRPFGVILLLLLFVYVGLAFRRKTSFQLRSVEFWLPTKRAIAAQIGVGAMDWFLAGITLYVLLPPNTGLSAFDFLGVYLLAQMIGLISHVPGGLGVLESIVVYFVSSNQVPAAAVLGSVLIYRVIYYFLPLFVAAVTLTVYELREKRELVQKVSRIAEEGIATLAPPVLSAASFLAGAVLLFSAAVPPIHKRIDWLGNVLPLPFLELSHFMSSLAGAGLIMLSLSLRKRVAAAYHIVLGLLVAGIILSLLKGGDYEEAIILGTVFAILLPAEREFHRKASIFSPTWRLDWLLAVGLVLAATFWLGLFSYKHVTYSDQLFWQFTLHGEAPRFLRAIVGIFVTVGGFSLGFLLRPSRPKPILPSDEDVLTVEKIVAVSAKASHQLALLGDKRFVFTSSGTEFLMYGMSGKSWIALGDPTGTEEEQEELTWLFKDMCDEHGARAVFYDVGRKNLDLYADLGLSPFPIGEAARVPLAKLSSEDFKRRFIQDRYVFEVVSKEQVPQLLPELREISEGWLKEKGIGERSFSESFFSENYIRRFPVALVRSEKEIVAFSNLWLSGMKEEATADLLRHRPKVSSEVVDWLLIKSMTWARNEGYRWFGLKTVLSSEPETVRKEKETYRPVWEPRYVACPDGLSVPAALKDVAALVALPR